MSANPILTASNGFLRVTNYAAIPSGTQTFTGWPLGTVGDSATGELGVKVILLGSQLSPVFANATGGGTTTAGKRVLTFIFSTDYSGTIGGVPFAGADDSSVELRAPEGCTLAAVAYTVAAGSIRIVQL